MLPPLVDLLLERDEDLLLPVGAGEVALAVGLADPGERECLRAVEVLRALGDREALLAEPVAVVAGVLERLLDLDVDAADRIDHVDEPREVELARSTRSGCRAGRRPRSRACACRRRGTRRGGAPRTTAASSAWGRRRCRRPSGTFTRSRGSDTIDTVWPTGSSETTIIVSVSISVRFLVASTPDEQDVDPLRVARAVAEPPSAARPSRSGPGHRRPARTSRRRSSRTARRRRGGRSRAARCSTMPTIPRRPVGPGRVGCRGTPARSRPAARPAGPALSARSVPRTGGADGPGGEPGRRLGPEAR